MSHINDRPEQDSAVSDINAATTLAMLSYCRDIAAVASEVSPSSPEQKPTKSTITITSSTTQGGRDTLAVKKARGSGAGSYERKDSAAIKPLPKNLPVLPKERHIPAYKKKTCALTFPERLMSMLDYADEMKAKSDDPGNYCVTWLPEGDAFLVRDPKACAEAVIPKFFKAAKFSSFARKLYRWGFHQIQRQDPDSPALPAGAIIFASEHFKRDARHEMAKMCSTTAARQKRKVNQIEGMEITTAAAATTMTTAASTGGSSLKAMTNSKARRISGAAGHYTSNLLTAFRGSVSSLSDVTTPSANYRPPLKKRAIDIGMPCLSIRAASFHDSSTITRQSSVVKDSSKIYGNNDAGTSFLPVLLRQPTSANGMTMNDQLSTFLSLMNQNNRSNQISLPPTQLASRPNLSVGGAPLLSYQGISGGYPVMTQFPLNRPQNSNDYLVGLFRSVADELEQSVI